jgi:hypothetical protein
MTKELSRRETSSSSPDGRLFPRWTFVARMFSFYLYLISESKPIKIFSTDETYRRSLRVPFISSFFFLCRRTVSGWDSLGLVLWLSFVRRSVFVSQVLRVKDKLHGAENKTSIKRKSINFFCLLFGRCSVSHYRLWSRWGWSGEWKKAETSER